MLILTSEISIKAPCAATIGCFDGVHRGHQRLMRLVLDQARRQGLTPTVITFDRLPRQLFDPTFQPQLLTTSDEKEACLQALGISQMAVLPFTRETAALTAEAFMRDILHGQLNVKVLLTGYDNRFGHDRTEGFDDYVRYGQALGMTVLQGDAERMTGGEAVSSTAIRRLLADTGDVAAAARLLTRPYTLTGHVVAGEHIGHQLGFPTANLAPDCPDKLIPANGVYAVKATLDDRGTALPAMMNIGWRPTFQGSRRTLEVHVLGEVGDIYGHRLTVSFVQRLRDERPFDSREALAAQLARDREDTLRLIK